MKLPSFFKQTNNDQLNLLVSLCLIIAFCIKIFNVTLLNINVFTLDTYPYSEFLINFQGGFVRRGLIGEILFQLYKIHGYPMKLSLFIGCYLVFFVVIIFFFYQFKKHNFCWWLLLSPLLMNYPMYIVRKDYLLFVMFIGVMYLLRVETPSTLRKITAFLIIIFSLFLHEAFIFWGFPIYMLLLISNKNNRTLNVFLSIIPLCIFIMLCVYKGTLSTSHLIVDSWNAILPNMPLSYTFNSSIGAIGWDSSTTFMSHLKSNVGDGGIGIVITPLLAIAIYYMFTNFLPVFTNESNNTNKKLKMAISLLYSSLLICLFPMLTVLSCDVGRVFQYAAVATFGTLIILPHDKILSLYPAFYIKKIKQLNNSMEKFLPPSQGLLIVLLFLLGISTSGFSLGENWFQCIFGTLWFGLVESGKFLLHLIF